MRADGGSRDYIGCGVLSPHCSTTHLDTTTKPVVTRLRVIVPLNGLTERELAERRAAVDVFLRGQASTDFVVLEDSPHAVETDADHQRAAHAVRLYIDERGHELAEGGFDAVIVWCAGDPGVRAARALLPVPIVGPGESALHVAHICSERFSVLCPVDDSVASTHQLIADTGMGTRLHEVGSIGIPVLELRKDMPRTIQAIERVARPLIAAGSTAIVLNCMGFFGMGRQVAHRLGVRVVDPAAAALGMALALTVDSAVHGGPATCSPCT